LMSRTLVVDASVAVKWFKKGEDFEEEALSLKDDVLSSMVAGLAPELMQLEVCRALLKAGYSSEKIRETHATLSEMDELGFLKSVPTSALKSEAKDLMVDLNLYVCDALSLATAVVSSSDLLTEDRHLLKTEVREAMNRLGLRTLRLKDAYGRK